MPRMRITLRRSTGNLTRVPRECLRTLGLRRIGQTVVRDSSPRLSGLLRKVAHLVETRPAEEPD